MKKVFILLFTIITFGLSIKAIDYNKLELKICKVASISYYPSDDWPYKLQFLVDLKCDSIGVDLKNPTSFANSLKEVAIPLQEPVMSLFIPYTYYSLINDLSLNSMKDSLYLYMQDCVNSKSENSVTYDVLTLNSKKIICEVTEVIGVFFIDNHPRYGIEAVLVSLMACKKGDKIVFFHDESLSIDDSIWPHSLQF